jgi:hypothetical protein
MTNNEQNIEFFIYIFRFYNTNRKKKNKFINNK